VPAPINLKNWIEENREKFKPPVSNRYLYDGRDFFVMVIKGPNARNDFHLVDSEEYFYQLKGDIKVRVREGDRIVDHLVREGETFFIPPNVPHAPVRPPDTIGVVVERRRPPGEREHVIFYCENCGALVEDIDTGFIVQARAPTLIVFDTPNGKVDATFFGPNNHTTFTANMTLNGEVVVPTTSGGPNLTIRQP